VTAAGNGSLKNGLNFGKMEEKGPWAFPICFFFWLNKDTLNWFSTQIFRRTELDNKKTHFGYTWHSFNLSKTDDVKPTFDTLLHICVVLCRRFLNKKWSLS
jgi:hypothetical protein